jgi:hypothetical protein
MKKTLLLSVVASTMIMAGGDIAPVEPVVEAPVETSAWTYGGQAVAFLQTTDAVGNGDLFTGNDTFSALGVQLRATNKDIFAGIGAGVEVSAIVQDDNFSNTIGRGTVGDAQSESAGITQAYLTYGFDSINTSIKVGRQTLPKSLSPFAYSEGWQIFKNTFDAALVVNSSLPDTTLVYAYVTAANRSVGPALETFNRINPSDAVHMFTAQNKSISNLTLTGTWYYAPDMVANLGFAATGDANILWGDAKYDAGSFTVAVQGGQISPDGFKDTTAFGAKVAGNFGMFGLSAAYSTVNDGALALTNFGTGVKSPLYTQATLNQNTISLDSDTLKLAATAKALGGKFTAYYINSNLGTAARAAVFGTTAGAGSYDEYSLNYKTKLTENTTVFASYVYQDDNREADTQNFVRLWARYNFN